MSSRTVRGKTPSFTGQPSPRSCLMPARWSSESCIWYSALFSASWINNQGARTKTKIDNVWGWPWSCSWFFSSSDGDRKVIKSVGRILSIWEERAVYSGSLITELKSTLTKTESPPETPVEQKSECPSSPLFNAPLCFHSSFLSNSIWEFFFWINCCDLVFPQLLLSLKVTCGPQL